MKLQRVSSRVLRPCCCCSFMETFLIKQCQRGWARPLARLAQVKQTEPFSLVSLNRVLNEINLNFQLVLSVLSLSIKFHETFTEKIFIADNNNDDKFRGQISLSVSCFISPGEILSTLKCVLPLNLLEFQSFESSALPNHRTQPSLERHTLLGSRRKDAQANQI